MFAFNLINHEDTKFFSELGMMVNILIKIRRIYLKRVIPNQKLAGLLTLVEFGTKVWIKSDC